MHRRQPDPGRLRLVNVRPGEVAAGQLGLNRLELPADPRDYADRRWADVGRQPPLQNVGDVLGLLGGGGEALDLRRRPVECRAVPDLGLQIAVEVVDLLAAENALCDSEDRLAGPVVDLQSPGAAARLDADARQAHAVVVDALMCVSRDEQVVCASRDARAQQPPLRGVQVLRLVDDGVRVQPGVAAGELLGGHRGDLDPGRPVTRCELAGEPFDRAPHLFALATRQATTPSWPWRHRVLGQGVDVLGEDDLLPFGNEESVVDAERVEARHACGLLGDVA